MEDDPTTSDAVVASPPARLSPKSSTPMSCSASEGITPLTTTTEPQRSSYVVRYEGNSSKRWDGREIVLDGSWLELLYQPSELVNGKRVCLPWMAKGGKVKNWNAVVVGSEQLSETNLAPSDSSKGILCKL